MELNNDNNSKKDSIYLCKVTAVSKNFFEVVTTEKENGIVYLSDVSDYFVSNLRDVVHIGDIFYLVYKSMKDKDTIIFSFKKNKSPFLRSPFDFGLEKENSYFQGLLDHTNKEIKKWNK